MSILNTNIPEYSVSDLSNAIKRSIEDNFAYVRVRGEVSKVSIASTGHCYFDIKDEKSVLSVVIWKGVLSSLKIKPTSGMSMVVTGKISTFSQQSKYQMVANELEPDGIGALYILFEQLKAKLTKEGLFSEDRKRPLPFLPKIIGIITSEQGAVLHDMITRMRSIFPCELLVSPVRVQGPTCAEEVIKALHNFENMKNFRPDIVIIARGGGSIEDLWGFNDENLIRAVSQSSLIVVSAIGHEPDYTLLDFVADKRAPTPTAAIEIILPNLSYLKQRISNFKQKIDNYNDNLINLAERNIKNNQNLLQNYLPNLYQKCLSRFTLNQNKTKSSIINFLNKQQIKLGKTAQFSRIDAHINNINQKANFMSNTSNYILNRLNLLWQAKQNQIFINKNKISLNSLENILKNQIDNFSKLRRSFLLRHQQLFAQFEQKLFNLKKIAQSGEIERVLKRGFTIISSNNQIITSLQNTFANQDISIRFYDGIADGLILNKTNNSNNPTITEINSKNSSEKDLRKKQNKKSAEINFPKNGSLF